MNSLAFERSIAARSLLGLLLIASAACMTSTAGAQVTLPSTPPVSPLSADTVRAGRFDNGKMWTFEHPPTAYLRETYNFAPDSAWYRKARLGALRLPGCSASLVSARGLVMTNHHCAREAATEVKRAGENILDNGFYARTENDERRATSMHADQLIAIHDITAQLDSAAAAVSDTSAREAARERAEADITQRLVREHGEKNIEVQLIELWNGARTSAYVFRRYTDVRLVMTPELQIGYFGGDPDNFTYPRYALDFTFLRVYGDDGRPLATPDYFQWSSEGIRNDDLVFVIGNPGSTSRLQTVAQLQFRRDVQDNSLVHLLNDRVDAYEEYVGAQPNAPETVINELFSFLNAEKAYMGMLGGLRDPYIIARRLADERAFRDSIRARPALAGEYGELHDRIAALQERKYQLQREVKAFTALGHPTLDAAVFRRALFTAQYLNGRSGGAPAQALDAMKQAILAIPDQPAQLQEALMAGRLRDVQWGYGAGSAESQAILGGRSPEVLAAAIQQSALADSASAATALNASTFPDDDPAVRVAREIITRARPFQTGMAGLSGEEEALERGIGLAKFEVYGLAIPPDATFSLRLADGVVKGYEYNGTVAPTHTTLYGLFDRYHSHQSKDWALPQRWLDRAAALNLTTPANFISTADIIGGNSGSPVVDRNLRVVGLVFDGNIESLPGDYIYLDIRSRAVAVDVRGILESLRTVYRADRLVRELTGGR
jgi:hypothetical protein